MRTVSAVIAALISVTVFAPAAFGANLSPADALMVSSTPASVGTTVTSDSVLGGKIESLEGVPLAADGQLRMRVSATNSSASALENVVLRLAVTREPLATRQALADFVADPTAAQVTQALQEPPAPDDNDATDDGGPQQVSASIVNTRAPASGDSVDTDTEATNDDEVSPVGERIGPGASTTFTLTASAKDLGLPQKGWGVHGATLTLVSDDVEVIVDSFALTWGAGSVPELDLAVLATTQGSPATSLTTLDTTHPPGVAVAVDPMELTLQHLVSNSWHDREVFRLPAHTADLTSIAHAGNDNLMPLALAVPGSIEVAAVSSAPWLAVPAALDVTSVALAAELDAAAVLAVPTAAGYQSLKSASSGPVVSAQDIPVLVPDTVLSHTVERYRPGTPVAAALALADSALLAGETPNARTLVALDSQWHNGIDAQSALSALLNAPWVSSIPVGDLIDDPGDAIGLPESLDIPTLLPADLINQLGERLDEFDLLASITESPEDAKNGWSRDLLQGVSVHHDRGEAARVTALRDALEQADQTLTAVRIADSSDLNLLTDSGDIPIHVINGLEHPITVTVDLNSFSSNLQILDAPTVTVPAATDQVAHVPVEAVSNANVFVAAVLRNADGDVVSETQSFSIRVRADWGSAATAVFTVVLIILLIAGLIRTIRRGRKDTRVNPSAPPETMGGDNG